VKMNVLYAKLTKMSVMIGYSVRFATNGFMRFVLVLRRKFLTHVDIWRIYIGYVRIVILLQQGP